MVVDGELLSRLLLCPARPRNLVLVLIWAIFPMQGVETKIIDERTRQCASLIVGSGSDQRWLVMMNDGMTMMDDGWMIFDGV